MKYSELEAQIEVLWNQEQCVTCKGNARNGHSKTCASFDRTNKVLDIASKKMQCIRLMRHSGKNTITGTLALEKQQAKFDEEVLKAKELGIL